jgi:signal transduction histidine kinase
MQEGVIPESAARVASGCDELLEAVARRKRELAILADISVRHHRQEDVQEILDSTLDGLLDGLELRSAWVLLDDGDGRLRLAAHRGISETYLALVERKGLGECLCREVFGSGQGAQARNTTQCPRMPMIGEGLEQPAAHACVPLAFKGPSRGVLNVAALPGMVFEPEELRFLETVGRELCLAMEGAQHLKAERLLYEKATRAYRDLADAQARIIENEKMAVVGTFASGLAHEVRNPLNSIALQLSVLERRVAPLPAPVASQMKELLAVIREEVKRLDNLVGDFLLFSRSNRVQYRPTSLESLLEEVARLLRPEARAGGVTLHLGRTSEPVPDLRVDPEKIKQVVINLVRNGIEAMPHGGTITIDTGLVDGHAQLSVRDTGPGLPEGIDVFELFVTTKPRGTGLGLSIAQQIVVEHGGTIAATSRPGQGATFTIRLPVERPETAAGDET